MENLNWQHSAMPKNTIYVVSKQYTRFPGGRKRKNGEHSGEDFRESVVLPLLDQCEFIVFDLSGSAGYSTGFLDEAFGEIGAILGLKEARRRVEFVADDDPEAVETCWRRIEDASSERGA